MLALVAALALSQCTKDVECKGERVCADGVCVESRTPRQSPIAAQFDAQRPALYWPISSLVAGVAAFAVSVVLSALDGRSDWMVAGASLGGGLAFGGLVSLFTTLWARARVGAMMDEAR